jgi:hypothetical protein
MNEEGLLKPALTGGVLLGILSAIPFINIGNCFCCAWVIGGGLVAAYMYVKDSPLPVSLGRGAVLGLLTGIVGTITYAIFSIPLNYLTRDAKGRFLAMLYEALEDVQNVPPETYERLESLFGADGSGMLFFLLSLMVTFVIFSLFSMAGGTIGVAVFEKRKIGSLRESMTDDAPPSDFSPPYDSR